VTSHPFTFRARSEDEPGALWRSHFAELWPAYRRWFLQSGDSARASYASSRRVLREHMPEIVPLWERLVELAGGGDLEARMLSMVDPPPYLSGCSQAVFDLADGPLLVRNYDYSPSRLEGVILRTGWQGRRVVGTSDCLWGLLDGVNEDGLAVSLTFGGRAVVGHGIGVPLVVRYLLQTCASVAEARPVLARLPYHLAHNLTLCDASGERLTACVAPDRETVVLEAALATNHQLAVEWPEHAQMTRTLEREDVLGALVADRSLTRESAIGAFLEPPLFATQYATGFGTTYTAAYAPVERTVEYRWPGRAWTQSIDAFADGEVAVSYDEPAEAA
jgi:predicted choloylglycine hydrolase